MVNFLAGFIAKFVLNGVDVRVNSFLKGASSCNLLHMFLDIEWMCYVSVSIKWLDTILKRK